MTAEKYIKLQNKLRESSEALYKNDKGFGLLANKVLTALSALDSDASERVNKMLLAADKEIFTKNDLIQKIVINRILITHLLKLRSANKFNVTTFLLPLSYKLDNKKWEKVITKTILPAMVKSKLI